MPLVTFEKLKNFFNTFAINLKRLKTLCLRIFKSLALFCLRQGSKPVFYFDKSLLIPSQASFIPHFSTIKANPAQPMAP